VPSTQLSKRIGAFRRGPHQPLSASSISLNRGRDPCAERSPPAVDQCPRVSFRPQLLGGGGILHRLQQLHRFDGLDSGFCAPYTGISCDVRCDCPRPDATLEWQESPSSLNVEPPSNLVLTICCKLCQKKSCSSLHTLEESLELKLPTSANSNAHGGLKPPCPAAVGLH